MADLYSPVQARNSRHIFAGYRHGRPFHQGQRSQLIAGGGKNLGAADRRKQFVEAGARGIIIHYNSDPSSVDAEKTLAELKALGADAILFQGDLSVVDNNVRLFDEAVAHFGVA